MKTGTSDGIYIRYKENRYKYMKEDGFDACDLDLSNTELDFYRDPQLILREKALADEAGIFFSQVHGPWRYPPRDETEEDRAERFEKMRICLELTRLVGCKYMVVHPIMPFGSKSDGDYKVFFEMNVEFYKKLIPHAEKNGVYICIENMPMSRLTISPPKNTAELIYALDSEWVKMCLDTGHSIVKGVQPSDALTAHGELIKTLHIHDSDGTRDQHKYPFAKDGAIDWKAFSKALYDSGFDGVLSLETEIDENFDGTAHRLECKKLSDIVKKLKP